MLILNTKTNYRSWRTRGLVATGFHPCEEESVKETLRVRTTTATAPLLLPLLLLLLLRS